MSQLESQFKTLRPLTLMGDVGPRLVFDNFTGEECVLKTFHPSDLEDGDSFRCEQHLAFMKQYATVKHANLNEILRAEKDGEGMIVLSKFQRGASLHRICQHQTMTYQDFRALARGLLQAVAAIHDNNIVHGDLTSRSVLLESDLSGTLSVTLAEPSPLRSVKVVRSHSLKERRMTGLMYSDPDKLKSGKLSVEGDLFSLGCIFYFSLSGSHPFQGDSTEKIVDAINSGSYRRLSESRPDLPGWLCQWVEGHLSISPQDRPESASESLKVLGQLANDDPEAASRSRGRAVAEGVPAAMSFTQFSDSRRAVVNSTEEKELDAKARKKQKKTPQPISAQSALTQAHRIESETRRQMMMPDHGPDMERLSQETNLRYVTPITDTSTDSVIDTAVMWHYSKGGSAVMGPVTEDEILYLLATGELTRKDPVWNPSLGEWRRLGDTNIIENSRNRLNAHGGGGLLSKLKSLFGTKRSKSPTVGAVTSLDGPRPTSLNTRPVFASTRTIPIANVSKNWHYAVGDKIQGPVTEVELRRLIETSILGLNDLVWTESFPHWRRICDTRILQRASVRPSIHQESLIGEDENGPVQRFFLFFWFELLLALAGLIAVIFLLYPNESALNLRVLIDCSLVVAFVGWLSLKIRAVEFDGTWFILTICLPILGDLAFALRNPFKAWKGLLLMSFGIGALFLLNFHEDFYPESREAYGSKVFEACEKIGLFEEKSN